MALDPTIADQSTTTLLKELVTGVGELVKKEAQLARAEMLSGMQEARRASLWVAAALVPGAVALVLIALAIAYALAEVMPMWLAALLPAVVLLALSGVLAWVAKQRISSASSDMKPVLAAHGVQRDAEFLADRAKQLKDTVTG